MSYSRLVSGSNRLLDALQALPHPARRRYRHLLLRIIEAAQRGWASADYGAGYLYQSFPRLGLRGFRQTEVRVAQMGIHAALAGQRVLEIGCNAGFLALALAPGTAGYVAFDNNPFLIEMARLTQAELDDSAVQFLVAGIEDFAAAGRFDVVLSFANHSTWDGNLQMPLQAYFAKLHALLESDGLLFFESHHPALENAAKLQKTLAVLQQYFVIQDQRLLRQGSAWDRGRMFVVARPSPTLQPPGSI